LFDCSSADWGAAPVRVHSSHRKCPRPGCQPDGSADLPRGPGEARINDEGGRWAGSAGRIEDSEHLREVDVGRQRHGAQPNPSRNEHDGAVRRVDCSVQGCLRERSGHELHELSGVRGQPRGEQSGDAQGDNRTHPDGRLGETSEAAHFAVSLWDGRNMYQAGNFFPVSGGYNNA